MKEGFIAACRHCGAPHSLALLDATAPCSYCKTPDPLDAPAQARIEDAAAKVCRLAARSQRQERLRDELSFDQGLMATAFAIPSWLLFGGIALAMVYSEKPSRLSLWQLLNTEQIGGGNTPETGTVLAFWLLFLIIAGVELSLFTVFTSLWFLRKPLPPPRALPPLDAQSPPRCHLCGAGLTQGGLTRRCRHCGTNNLVDGRAFDAQITALHEQLSWIEHEVLSRGELAGRASDKVIMASAFYPIGLLLALPLGMIGTPRTAPELVPALYVLAALVALSVLAWLSRSSSNALPFVTPALGATVHVKGRRYTVIGRIDAPPNGAIAGADSLAILRSLDREGLELAINPFATRDEQRCFELRSGGAPLESPAPHTTSLTLASAQGPTSAACTQEPSPRIFIGALNTGTTPQWTLVAASIGEDELLLR
ncbi:MAG: hypothetical protein U0269_31430 [Polyangiales bacterium]